MPTADQTTPDTTGPVIVSLICGASRSEETIKIDRARWDAMTPTERADLLDEEVDTLIGNAGGAGWHIANPDDEAAVGETTSVHRLTAELEQARADRDRARQQRDSYKGEVAALRDLLTAVRADRNRAQEQLAAATRAVSTLTEALSQLADDWGHPARAQHTITRQAAALTLMNTITAALAAHNTRLAGDTTPAGGEIVRIDREDDVWRRVPARPGEPEMWKIHGYTPLTLEQLERLMGPTRLTRLVPVPTYPDPVSEPPCAACERREADHVDGRCDIYRPISSVERAS